MKEPSESSSVFRGKIHTSQKQKKHHLNLLLIKHKPGSVISYTSVIQMKSESRQQANGKPDGVVARRAIRKGHVCSSMLQQYPCSVLKTMGTIVREIPVIFVHTSGPPLWGQMAFESHLCSPFPQDTFQRHLDVPVWSTQISWGILWALQSSPETRGWRTLVLAWTWWNNVVNLLHTRMKSSHTADTLQWPNSECWNPLWDLLYSEIFKSSEVLLLMIDSHFNSFEKFYVCLSVHLVT